MDKPQLKLCKCGNMRQSIAHLCTKCGPEAPIKEDTYVTAEMTPRTRLSRSRSEESPRQGTPRQYESPRKESIRTSA